MFFTESEYLLRSGVAGKAVIEAVDAFLYAREREDVFTEDLVVGGTGQPRQQVRAALAGYAADGTVKVQRMVRCPTQECRTLTPVERVERSRADGDEEPCDGPCGHDLAALSDPEVVNAYNVVALPVP